jgi:hypothetical protein
MRRRLCYIAIGGAVIVIAMVSFPAGGVLDDEDVHDVGDYCVFWGASNPTRCPESDEDVIRSVFGWLPYRASDAKRAP